MRTRGHPRSRRVSVLRHSLHPPLGIEPAGAGGQAGAGAGEGSNRPGTQAGTEVGTQVSTQVGTQVGTRVDPRPDIRLDMGDVLGTEVGTEVGASCEQGDAPRLFPVGESVREEPQAKPVERWVLGCSCASRPFWGSDVFGASGESDTSEAPSGVDSRSGASAEDTPGAVGGDFEVVATPTGRASKTGRYDPSLNVGRAGFARPRSPGGGHRFITHYEQRIYAARLKVSPFRSLMRQETAEYAGESAYAHYERTGAEPGQSRRSCWSAG